MRTCSPYVALPFDPGRVRPELVGLLLHPVSRSETWRRLGTPRTLLRSPRGFHSKDAGPGSWRRAEKLPPQSLGGRVPDCRDGPIRRKPNSDLIHDNYTRSGGFSQARRRLKRPTKWLYFINLQAWSLPIGVVSGLELECHSSEVKLAKIDSCLNAGQLCRNRKLENNNS